MMPESPPTMKFTPDPSEPRGRPPLPKPIGRLRPWLLAFVYWITLVPLSYAPRINGNVWSRYMTIESIVERGTLVVSRSPLLPRSGTVDLVKFRGKLYSDKPPVLPALTSAIYLPMSMMGLPLYGPVPQMILANWVLVTTTVGVASAFAVGWLRQLLQATNFRRWVSDLLALGCGYGSLVFSYAVTYNNHSVAAALLTGALAMVILEPAGSKPSRRRAFGGFLAALAATMDLPAGGTILAALGILLFVRERRFPLAFALGAVGPILLHCGLQSLVTGTPLPSEMYPESFEYEGAFWTTQAGRWEEVGPRWSFGIEFLLGYQGWLTVTPALALGLAGIGLVAARRSDPLRPSALALGSSLALILAYYIWGVRRTDYAGFSFGTRHMLALTPCTWFFAAAGLDRLRSRWANAAFVPLVAIGLIYAFLGMIDPWARIDRPHVDPRLDAVVARLRPLVIYKHTSFIR